MKKVKFFLVAICVMLAAAGFAQDTAAQKPNGKTLQVKSSYTCSMHPSVRSEKPGKCPKCGMSLVKVNEDAAAKIYTCPMHAEVSSSKPGKCPKCKMKLILKKEA